MIGVVVLAGGTLLTMQFLKEVPNKKQTIRSTKRPGPNDPGGGPGGSGAPGPTGGMEGMGRPGAGSDASKATPEEPAK